MGSDLLMSRHLVLASASPSRKRLLTAAGVRAEVVVSGVDEELPEITSLAPSEMVIALAILKAHTVKELVPADSIIVGCDSTFEFDGRSLGKPLTAANAIARAQGLRGKSGLLHTGHCVIDLQQGIEISDISTSRVYFAQMSDAEIKRYVASGEPLNVAGGFTLDGLSSPFIEKIEGCPTGIIGLSLPLLRTAILSLGLSWSEIAEMDIAS